MTFDSRKLNMAVCKAIVPITVALSGCFPQTDYAGHCSFGVCYNENGAVRGFVSSTHDYLLEAVQSGDLKAVESQIKNKDDVNAALRYAAGAGQLRVAQMLLEKQGDVNSKTELNITALMMAAGAGHKDMVEWLIANNADVNAEGYYGITALSQALQNKHPDIAEMLVQHGAKK